MSQLKCLKTNFTESPPASTTTAEGGDTGGDEMTMRVAQIIQDTYVDGPGQRVALFTQGCSVRRRGCQNAHLWPANGGKAVPVAHLAERLLSTGLPVTITGGEPTDQAAALAQLLRLLCAANPDLHIILYSGRTFEQLLERAEPAILEALNLADVLVDGPYIADLDHPGLQYRGSANQRVIDLPETLRAGNKVITLDWDTPEIIVTTEGDLLGAVVVAAQFQDLGIVADTRRCGETNLRECREDVAKNGRSIRL